MAAPLTPVERSVLLTAFAAPNHTLTRTRAGFVSPTEPNKVFTRRAMNWLDRRALLNFDDPEIPRSARLTPAGVREAEQALERVRDNLGAGSKSA